MSNYKNFKPDIMIREVMFQLKKALVARPFCNTSFEGQIKNMGDTVTFLGIGEMAASAYTGTPISYGNIDNKSQKLIIDKAHYIAKTITDVDRIQAIPELLTSVAQEMAYGFADAIDQGIFGLYGDAGHLIDYSSTGVDSSNILSALTEASAKLKKDGKVPAGMRMPLFVDSWVARAITHGAVLAKTDNGAVYGDGYIGNVAGFAIVESNNSVSTGTYAGGDLVVNCMSFTPNRAVGLAVQKDFTLEALRDPDDFADLMRGLIVWGVKTLRSNEMANVKLKVLAETNI